MQIINTKKKNKVILIQHNKFMNNEFEFSIPATLNDIKLSQWQQYVDVLEKNKDAELTDFLEKKLLGIFCGVQLKDINKIGLSVFDTTITHLSNVLNSKADLIRTFKMTGTDGVTVEFGLIPNFDKMSYGEFVDLEKYIFVDKDFHRAMAVMYRPIKFKSKDSYLIHDYKGTEYLAEVMKNTPLDVALGGSREPIPPSSALGTVSGSPVSMGRDESCSTRFGLSVASASLGLGIPPNRASK